MWVYVTYSGTISGGADNQQFYMDLNGTAPTSTNAFPTKKLSPLFRGFTSSGNASTGTEGFGTDALNSPGPSVPYTSDVWVMSCAAGQISSALGSWSSGFPAITSLSVFNAGSIQQSVITPSAPYAAYAGLAFRFVTTVAPINMSNRKIIIKAMKFEGL